MIAYLIYLAPIVQVLRRDIHTRETRNGTNGT